jgi:hypothetical protein
MASASDARAGGAFVELYAKDTTQAVLQDIQNRLKSMAVTVGLIGASMAALGASITAPLLHGLNVASEWSGGIVAASRQTGIEVEALGSLTYALKTDFDGLATATRTMDGLLEQAINNPAGEAAQRIDALGLSIDALQRMSQADRLRAFAGALGNIGDQGQRIANARAVFGRQGANLDVSGGAAGIASREQHGRDIGAVMSAADLDTIRQYNAATRELGIVTKAVWSSIGVAIAPVMTEFTILVTNVISVLKTWVDNSRPLIATIFKIADGLVTVGTIIGVVAGGFYGLSLVAGFLAPTFTALTGTLAILTTGLAFLPFVAGAAALALGAFFLLRGPVGIPAELEYEPTDELDRLHQLKARLTAQRDNIEARIAVATDPDELSDLHRQLSAINQERLVVQARLDVIVDPQHVDNVRERLDILQEQARDIEIRLAVTVDPEQRAALQRQLDDIRARSEATAMRIAVQVDETPLDELEDRFREVNRERLRVQTRIELQGDPTGELATQLAHLHAQEFEIRARLQLQTPVEVNAEVNEPSLFSSILGTFSEAYAKLVSVTGAPLAAVIGSIGAVAAGYTLLTIGVKAWGLASAAASAIAAAAAWSWGVAVAGAKVIATAASWAYGAVLAVVSSGFGVLTLVSWAWAAATVMAKGVATAAMIVWGGVVAVAMGVASAANFLYAVGLKAIAVAGLPCSASFGSSNRRA